MQAGIECSRGHFIHSDCFREYVAHETTLIRICKNFGLVCCPAVDCLCRAEDRFSERDITRALQLAPAIARPACAEWVRSVRGGPRVPLVWEAGSPAPRGAEHLCRIAVALHAGDRAAGPADGGGAAGDPAWIELWACGAQAQSAAVIGMQLWPSSVALTRYLCQPGSPHGPGVHGAAVCELGCGEHH